MSTHLMKWSVPALAVLVFATGCGVKDTSRSVTIALDATTARTSAQVATGYAVDARRLADPVLEHGGHLRIVLVGGAGVAPAVLVDEDVPPPSALRATRASAT